MDRTGGREASFDGRLSYPSAEQPGDGYGVLQSEGPEFTLLHWRTRAGAWGGVAVFADSRPRRHIGSGLGQRAPALCSDSKETRRTSRIGQES